VHLVKNKKNEGEFAYPVRPEGSEAKLNVLEGFERSQELVYNVNSIIQKKQID